MEFNKYATRGAYHWPMIETNVIRRDAYVLGRYTKCLQLLIGASPKAKRILDLGCGDGVLTYLLYKSGYEATGIDTSKLGITFASEQHKKRSTPCEFICGHSSELSNVSYDAIVSSDVIEHVEDPTGFIREIDRLLIPGGVAILSTPIRITEDRWDKEHIKEWFPTEWRELFSAYDDVKFFNSHPVAFMELMSNKYSRIALNTLSLVSNPFHWRGRFRCFHMQYAVFRKPETIESKP